MKEKIIARLKALFSGVNLSNTRLDAIADKLATKITDENLIDARLNELNEIMPFAEIAKQDDKVRTLEAAAKKKSEAPKTDPVVDEPVKVADDAPEWAKTLAKQNQDLLKKIENMESGSSAEKNRTRLRAILKEKKVEDAYLDDPLRKLAIESKTFKDDEELQTFAISIAEGYSKHVQELADKGLGEQPAPVMGVVKDGTKEISPMMTEYLKDKNPEATKKAS